MASRTPSATSMLDDEHDFPQPTGGRGDSLGSGLDDHRRISETGHVYLLVGKVLYPSLKGGTFYACPLQTRSRCAIRGKGIPTLLPAQIGYLSRHLLDLIQPWATCGRAV